MNKRIIIALLLSITCCFSFAQTYKYDAANRLIQVSSNCSGTIYTYDANGNRKSITQISIQTTSSISDEKCGNDGQITITTTNPGLYIFQWSNGQIDPIIKNLPAGTYSVIITETTSGFTCNQSFTVNPAFKDSLRVDTQPTVCIGSSDGTAKLKIVTPNPKGTYTYHWSVSNDTSYTTTDSISNLKHGNYSVNIRNSYTGCIKKIDFTVGEPNRFLTGISTTPLSCYKSNDGIATANVLDDPSAYSYAWTGPFNGTRTTRAITGLAPGKYFVTATQLKTRCVLTDSVTILDIAPFLTVTKTDITCRNANNGTAKAIVSGDPTQYAYAWTGPFTGTLNTPNITGLPPGKLRLTVSELFGNHCSMTDSVTIVEPAYILQDVAVTPDICGQNGGIAEAKVTGDASQYSYKWYYKTGGYTLNQTGYLVRNLQAGNYTLTLTSPNECIENKDFVIIKDSLKVSTYANSCFGGSAGSAKINIITANPKGTYTYHWNTGSNGGYSSVDSIANLKAGNYSVDIKNSDASCIRTIAFTIGEPPRFLTGVSSTPLSCYRSDDATAKAEVMDNPGLYTYAWTGPFDGVRSTQQISSLLPGTYTIVCTQKSTGCTLNETVTIADVPKFLSTAKTDSKCYLANNGTAKAIVVNNPSQYRYAWTGPSIGTASTQEIHGLPPGVYKVQVTENFGNHCSEIDSVTITQPGNILQDVIVTPTSCKGQADGTAEAKVSGPVTQYTYSWYSDKEGLTLPQNDYRATGLKAGTYMLTIQSPAPDFCTVSKQFEIKEAGLDLTSQLFPNPTTGLVTIKICTLIKGAIGYSIYSSNGQLLKNGTVQGQSGHFSLDLSTFPPATYAITVTVDGSNYSFGVIKI